MGQEPGGDRAPERARHDLLTPAALASLLVLMGWADAAAILVASLATVIMSLTTFRSQLKRGGPRVVVAAAAAVFVATFVFVLRTL
jgi:hypothetical protein